MTEEKLLRTKIEIIERFIKNKASALVKLEKCLECSDSPKTRSHLLELKEFLTKKTTKGSEIIRRHMLWVAIYKNYEGNKIA